MAIPTILFSYDSGCGIWLSKHLKAVILLGVGTSTLHINSLIAKRHQESESPSDYITIP